MSQRSIKLSNGMLIATDEMEEIETVAVSVLVKTGSRYESESNNGISHFLEHMAFKGTKTRTARQIAEEFDSIGGYFNAYTSREKTVYYAKVLKNDLSIAVDILSDILQSSIFADEEVEKEKGVILQEIAQTEDTPDDLIFDNFQETAYPNQPFGRAILGTRDFIKEVKRNDCVDYINKFYSFDNIIIAGAGNLDSDKFQKMVQEKFVSFPMHKSNEFQKAKYTGGDKRIERELEQVHIVLGFKSVSFLDNDYYTQQAFSIIAGGGMSSRLFQEVREKRGLAYTISAFNSSYIDGGILGIYTGTSQDKANKLFDVVFDELKKLTENITEEELKRAKAQVRAALLMSQESSVSRAEKLASNYAAFGRYISVEEIINKINIINVEDVKRFARKILSDGNMPTLAAIGKIATLYNYEDIVKKLKL